MNLPQPQHPDTHRIGEVVFDMIVADPNGPIGGADRLTAVVRTRLLTGIERALLRAERHVGSSTLAHLELTLGPYPDAPDWEEVSSDLEERLFAAIIDATEPRIAGGLRSATAFDEPPVAIGDRTPHPMQWTEGTSVVSSSGTAQSTKALGTAAGPSGAQRDGGPDPILSDSGSDAALHLPPKKDDVPTRSDQRHAPAGQGLDHTHPVFGSDRDEEPSAEGHPGSDAHRPAEGSDASRRADPQSDHDARNTVDQPARALVTSAEHDHEQRAGDREGSVRSRTATGADHDAQDEDHGTHSTSRDVALLKDVLQHLKSSTQSVVEGTVDSERGPTDSTTPREETTGNTPKDRPRSDQSGAAAPEPHPEQPPGAMR
ncbi:MAG: hypothetical protein AAGJ92_07075, partial [Pseudomonadota bacterium]